ncbi:MAG TPA: EAL domain-containing protein [Gammaproteobacteria bacterium]|nr:EAL domain-containing protein [Gammaproteobacteria bacterium]
MENRETGKPPQGSRERAIRYQSARSGSALPASDASLRSVIEHLQDGYYEVDLRGTFYLVNGALCRIHGYPRERLLGMNNREYTRPAVAREIYRIFNRVYRTGEPVEVFNYEIVHADGSTRIVDTSVHLVRDESGKPRGFRGILRDVTERKHNEAYERARNRLLERIARNAPLEETLSMVLASLEAQMPDATSALLLMRGTGLECAAIRGMHAEARRHLEESPAALLECPCLQAARNGERVVIESIEDDPRMGAYREAARADGVNAVWIEPVISAENEVLGLLVLCPRSSRAPGARELGWLESATATAEIALSHQRITGKLAYLSQHDALTGLLNRRSFMDEAERLIALARRKGWTPGLLFLDLNQFKPVNDSWGHQAGDRLLQDVTRRLRRVLRKGDSLARLGGDEFALLAPELHTDAARHLAGRIVEALRMPFDIGLAAPVYIGVSIGIAFADQPGISTDTLLARADAAMYQAKTGRSGWAFYEPERRRLAEETLAVEEQLRRALREDRVAVHYQPVRDLIAGNWRGVEALARMPGKAGLVEPGRFVPVAESQGLIEELDARVLSLALAETRAWDGWVSVNVSPHSLRNSDWPDIVARALERHGRSPASLVLEVTERVLPDLEEVAATLDGLAGRGVGIALDDFGAGYSSLRYLRGLSVGALKVDASFSEGLGTGSPNEPLVRGLLGLARSLGMYAVVQGIESAAALHWLKRNGCPLAQGRVLAEPAAWAELNLSQPCE